MLATTKEEGHLWRKELELKQLVIDKILHATRSVKEVRKHLVSIILVSSFRREQAQKYRLKQQRIWSKISDNFEVVCVHDDEIGYIIVTFDYNSHTRPEGIRFRDLREN